jgi:phosphatidylserine decarboxylase
MGLELAWGRFRRWYLKTFRPRYVARMQTLRRGEPTGCPHEVLDPRDLKFYRNQGRCAWEETDDPFRWRDRLPFARAGLAELVLLGGGFLLLAAVLSVVYWPAAIPAGILALGVAWFFRNPRRVSPTGVGLVVSPADGLVVSVEDVDYDDFIDGPAVLVGIFLSVFNVHINRAPVSARVIGLSYRPGKFLNAMRPASARENEQMAVRLEENSPPYRRLIVRQIAGAIARRIVCWVQPGDELQRGEQSGMIKFGSRTELVLPREEGLRIEVRPGQRVKAGSSIMARY